MTPKTTSKKKSLPIDPSQLAVEAKPAHSKIGASSMHRWSVCPGSVKLSQGLPNTESVYAAEGTLAHDHCSYRLDQGHWRKDIDDEMKEAAQVYTTAVLAHWNGVQDIPGSFILVEHRFDLSKVHPGLYGTADAVVYDASQKKLTVYDLKYGAGISVEVENNEQLQYYGLGALLTTNAPAKSVELVIVQPRCEHSGGQVRRWSFPALDLIDFASDLAKFASRTEELNAPLVSGDHCRFCPAAGVCPKLHEQALEAAQMEFSPSTSYDPVKLSETLAKLDMVEAFAKRVREFAYAEACHGRCPPGYKLVAKQARRRWKGDEQSTLFELAKAFNVPSDMLLDKPSLKSPAQVEKIIAKGKKAMLEPFVVSESSGNVLAPESDPRPPIKMDAAAEFEVLDEIEEKSEISMKQLRADADLFS